MCDLFLCELFRYLFCFTILHIAFDMLAETHQLVQIAPPLQAFRPNGLIDFFRYSIQGRKHVLKVGGPIPWSRV